MTGPLDGGRSLTASNVKMKNPGVAVNRQNMKRGDTVGQQQKTLIAIVTENLADNVSFWWDGHPALLADSFKRLREDIGREDRRRVEQQANLLVTNRGRGPRGIGPVTSPRNSIYPTRQYQPSPEVSDETSTYGSFTNLRLKEARCILKDYYGENYSDEILDTPLEQLVGQTPGQFVEKTSQSAEELYVVLGYRDPKTKRPIKRLPTIIL